MTSPTMADVAQATGIKLLFRQSHHCPWLAPKTSGWFLWQSFIPNIREAVETRSLRETQLCGGSCELPGQPGAGFFRPPRPRLVYASVPTDNSMEGKERICIYASTLTPKAACHDRMGRFCVEIRVQWASVTFEWNWVGRQTRNGKRSTRADWRLRSSSWRGDRM